MMGRLKYLRKHLKLTQSQLADILHIKQNSYSQIERGCVSLTDKNKYLLEAEYHLTPGWIDGKDVPMFLEGDAPKDDLLNTDNNVNPALNKLVESKGDAITMSREAFEQISQLIKVVLSQQRTIELLQEQNMKKKNEDL